MRARLQKKMGGRATNATETLSRGILLDRVSVIIQASAESPSRLGLPGPAEAPLPPLVLTKGQHNTPCSQSAYSPSFPRQYPVCSGLPPPVPTARLPLLALIGKGAIAPSSWCPPTARTSRLLAHRTPIQLDKPSLLLATTTEGSRTLLFVYHLWCWHPFPFLPRRFTLTSHGWIFPRVVADPTVIGLGAS